MPTDIKLKNSVTATNAPTSLQQGEVAINITDKKVWVGNAATTPVLLLGSGSDASFTNISVSGVASFADGTVSLPSITNIGDTNTGIYFPAADTIAFTEGGVESMRITSAGDVGIGTSSPSGKLHVSSADIDGTSIRVANTSSSNNARAMLRFISPSSTFGAGIFQTNAAETAYSASTLNLYTFDSQPMAFGTNNAERMRIDSSGNVMVGATSTTERFRVQSDDNYQISFKRNNATGLAAIGLDNTDNFLFYANTTERMRIDASGNVLVGTTTALDPLTVTNGITTNGGGLDFATSGTKNWQVIGNATDFYIGDQTLTRYASLNGITTFTAWTFVSDVRLKENIESLNYGINEVMQLKPTRYKFKNEKQTNIGFIAQEVKQVIPEMVTGSGLDFDEKDTFEERARKTLGVSKDILIPVLVKAIQEQQTLINNLTTRLNALEGK